MKSNQRSHDLLKILAYVFLMILPIIYISPFAHFQQIFSSGDFMFHAQRMEELYRDVTHGTFIPRISTYTFNQVGSGVNFFYPWLSLYPFVIFRVIVGNPVTSFYLLIVFYTYCTLFVSYCCMFKFSRSHSRSYFFALIYTFANYRFYLLLNQNVLAEGIAFTFLPLVFFGFYNVFFGDYRHWKSMAIGMSFILYSHMLTAFLTSLLFVVILVFTVSQIDNFKKRMISCIKAGVLCVLLTAFYLVPFLFQQTHNQLRGSWLGLMFVQTPMDTISNSLNNIPTQVIGFLLIIVIFFGPLFLRNAENIDKGAYFLGLILVLLTTTLFPWQLLKNTPIAVLQFPYRLNGLATFMLSVYLSFILAFLQGRMSASMTGRFFYVSSILVLVLLLDFGASVQVITERLHTPELQEKTTAKNYLPDKSRNFIIKDKDWNNLFGYFGHNGSFDYFPVTVKGNNQEMLVNHQALVNGKRIDFSQRITTRPNMLVVNLSRLKAGSVVKLPILYYCNDLIRVGNGAYSKPNRTSIETIEVTVPKGNKVAYIKYKDSLLDTISKYASLISWACLLLSAGYRKYWREEKYDVKFLH